MRRQGEEKREKSVWALVYMWCGQFEYAYRHFWSPFWPTQISFLLLHHFLNLSWCHDPTELRGHNQVWWQMQNFSGYYDTRHNRGDGIESMLSQSYLHKTDSLTQTKVEITYVNKSTLFFDMYLLVYVVKFPLKRERERKGEMGSVGLHVYVTCCD